MRSWIRIVSCMVWVVKITLDHMVAEGDIVAARWSGTATHSGDGLGFQATGRQVRLSGMTFARIQNGKLVEGWNVFDQLGMFQQLGAIAVPVLPAADIV